MKTLPKTYTMRPLSVHDSAAAGALFMAFDEAYLDEVTDVLSPADVRDWWLRYDLEHDSLAAAETGETLAALGLISAGEPNALELDAYVHPAQAGRGLGSFLVEWGEDEARARGHERLRANALARDNSAARLLEQRGFTTVRHFYRMVIDLVEAPPAPDWPPGVAVAPIAAGDEPVVYSVVEAAFADEWGRPHRTFEDWQRTFFGAESFDPTLCFVVRADGEAVAAELCSHRFGMGWIGTVGVVPAWRRQGLGKALLLHAFLELYGRGERRIGLGVDAANPTGATRLYEQVGMRVAWQADTYEKELH